MPPWMQGFLWTTVDSNHQHFCCTPHCCDHWYRRRCHSYCPRLAVNHGQCCHEDHRISGTFNFLTPRLHSAIPVAKGVAAVASLSLAHGSSVGCSNVFARCVQLGTSHLCTCFRNGDFFIPGNLIASFHSILPNYYRHRHEMIVFSVNCALAITSKGTLALSWIVLVLRSCCTPTVKLCYAFLLLLKDVRVVCSFGAIGSSQKRATSLRVTVVARCSDLFARDKRVPIHFSARHSATGLHVATDAKHPLVQVAVKFERGYSKTQLSAQEFLRCYFASSATISVDQRFSSSKCL